MTPKGLEILIHKGKEILYFDMQHLSTAAYIEGLDQNLDYLKRLGKNDLLLLLDGRNTYIFGEAFKAAMNFGKSIAPLRKKTALMGATGGKKIMLNSFLHITGTSTYVKSFDQIDKAKDWLAE